MINRKIVLYIFLLAIIVGSAPYFTGMLVQIKFQDVVKVISDSDTIPVVIEVTEYNRGWRKSFAKTRVTFLLGDNHPSNQYSIILEHEIRHGPFVQLHDNDYLDWHFARAMIHSKIMLNEEAKKILVEEIGHTELLNINSEMAINGIVRINLQGQPLKLKEHEGTDRIAWKGLSGQWILSSDLKDLTGKIVIPGLDIDLNGVHYIVGNLSYQTDLTQSPEGLWPGKFLGSLDKLTIENSIDNTKLQIDGITTGGMMMVLSGMTEFGGNLRIEKVIVNNKQYGPIDYANTLKNVEARVVKSIFELSHKLKIEDNSHPINHVQTLMAILPQLLKSRPEFSINQLQVHTEQGDVKATLTIAAGGPQSSDINKINEIILSVVANAHLSIPKLIMRDMLTSQYMKNAQAINNQAKNANAQSPSGTQTPILTDQQLQQQVNQNVTQTIAKWLNDGILIEQGENYISNVDVSQGAVNVNGHAIDLSHPKAMMGPAS